MNLTVAELPYFYLRFQDRARLELWRGVLSDIQAGKSLDHRDPPAEDDDYRTSSRDPRQSYNSSDTPVKSAGTTNTEGTNITVPPLSAFHIPVDIVVVVSVCSSTQGLKINLLRDSLSFLVRNLGPRDRMSLVTFGSSAGAVPVVGMAMKSWPDWNKALLSLKPVGQKAVRADVVDGANVAMDLLMQRRTANPVSNILLISDTATSDRESVDFVVSRAEAAKYVDFFFFFFFWALSPIFVRQGRAPKLISLQSLHSVLRVGSDP